MSKISSVNKDRISTYYVNRKINNQQVAKVDELERVNPIQNSMSNSSENYLLFSDMFYGKLRDLKQFYKKFYAHEQALEEVLEKFRRSDQPEEVNEWISIIIELFNKYNQALDSLRDFEREIGMDHSSKIIQTVHRYLPQLQQLGVSLKTNGHLDTSSKALLLRLEEDPSRINFLFIYQQGLLYDLNQIFKKIQARPNQSVFLEKMDQAINHYTSGQIVDKKS
ncbi:MAG: hypothetical protein D5S00_05105 [Tindallia sp. MSAO_Bac2]|nr:MAG: hypothetical protein D5S00_05105 [Tindallia sp. MSAO_Bac2]